MTTWRAREKEQIKRRRQNKPSGIAKTRQRNRGPAEIAMQGKQKRQRKKKAGAWRLRAYVVIETNTGLGFAARIRLSLHRGPEEGKRSWRKSNRLDSARQSKGCSQSSPIYIFSPYISTVSHFTLPAFYSHRPEAWRGSNATNTAYGSKTFYTRFSRVHVRDEQLAN